MTLNGRRVTLRNSYMTNSSFNIPGGIHTVRQHDLALHHKPPEPLTRATPAGTFCFNPARCDRPRSRPSPEAH